MKEKHTDVTIQKRKPCINSKKHEQPLKRSTRNEPKEKAESKQNQKNHHATQRGTKKTCQHKETPEDSRQILEGHS